MKLQAPLANLTSGWVPARNKGFTLPEILIALTIFLFLISGVIFANWFGLKMFQVTQTKLTATRWSRETIEKLTDQIHGCSSVQIGNFTTNGGFAGLLDGETNQGNGLIIYQTTNTTNYILYYVNLADQTFRRADQSGNTVILADSVTNSLPFSAQDILGNLLTNSANNELINLTLEFYRPGSYLRAADYYKMETSVKPRVVP